MPAMLKIAPHVVVTFKMMVTALIPVQMMVLVRCLGKQMTLLKLICNMPLLERNGDAFQTNIPEDTERDSKVEKVSGQVLMLLFSHQTLLPVVRGEKGVSRVHSSKERTPRIRMAKP